jgi:hypothetical protein
MAVAQSAEDDASEGHVSIADKSVPDPGPMSWCPIVELRQYALHPGRREELIQLFDEQFVESQEAVGNTVMGQFRDLDDANSFIWLRGFQSASERAAALAAFYDGPVWAEQRDRANATMLASDNVLLLRPARPGSGFEEASRLRFPSAIAREHRHEMLVATIYFLKEPADRGFVHFFEEDLASTMARGESSILAYYVTADIPNDFPRLPVREDGPVLVSFSTSARGGLPVHQRRVLKYFLRTEPEVHRLLPTLRSRLPSPTAVKLAGLSPTYGL